MEIEGFESAIPAEEIAHVNHGRREECLQAMVDLGYCRFSAKAGVIVEPGEAERAATLFRIDYRKAKLLHAKAAYEATLEGEREHHALLGSEELDLAQKLVSLDGEFNLEKLPAVGELSLLTRVLHYRLDVLGVYENAMDQPWSAAAYDALADQARRLNVNALDAARLSGNVPALMEQMFQQPRYGKNIVYFHHDPGNAVKLPLNIGMKFRWQIRKMLHKDDPARKAFHDKVDERDPDLTFVKSVMAQEDNLFLIRVLQVRQWMNGHYRGRLDADFGPMTFAAFQEFAEIEKELDSANFSEKHYLGHIKNGYWALNVVFLFKKILKSHDDKPVTTVHKVFDQYEEAINEASPGQLERLEGQTKTVWQKLNQELSEHFKKAGQFFRKVYHGVHSFLKRIGVINFFKKLFRVISKVLNTIKNLIKVLFREIREGLRRFAHGMKWMFGKRRLITADPAETGFIYIDFDFNWDGTCMIQGEVSKETMVKHAAELRYLAKSLYLSLGFCGKVIRIAIDLSTGPMGWRHLLLRIGKMIREKLDLEVPGGFAGKLARVALG